MRQKDTEIGGLEKAYRWYSACGHTRKQIAATLKMSECALGHLINRWNKAKKEQEREQVNP